MHRAISSIVFVLALPCCHSVATASDCESVGQHLADLQIKKEKERPFGRLLPPFDDAAHEKEIRDGAVVEFKGRCMKGWKKAVYECMMSAQDFETADKCRYL